MHSLKQDLRIVGAFGGALVGIQDWAVEAVVELGFQTPVSMEPGGKPREAAAVRTRSPARLSENWSLEPQPVCLNGSWKSGPSCDNFRPAVDSGKFCKTLCKPTPTDPSEK